MCAHVPVRSGGCRGGCRGRSGDAPLRRNLVPRFAQAELDAALAGLRSGLDRALRADGVLGEPGCTLVRSRASRALALWWLQLGLNAAWTPVFFGARRTGAAAVVIGALLPAVAATAAASARVDRRAGLLYAPYLAGRPMRPRSTSRSGGGTAPRRPSRDRSVVDRNCVDADAGGVGRAVPRPEHGHSLPGAGSKLRCLVARAVRGLRRPSVRMSSARWRSRPGRGAGARPRQSSVGNPEAGNPIIGAFGW